MRALVIMLFLSIISSFGLAKPLPSNTLPTQQRKPYLWVYWEDINGTKMPGYISLCRKTLYKHCNTSFTIVELDEKNIYKYLPELKIIEQKINFNDLKIAQKVDYYRVMLLCKYGGLYIDSDMIVMKDLYEIIEKLEAFDFVGFSRYSLDKEYHITYGKPQNWIMASRSQGTLVTKLLESMNQILESRLRYHDLGKYLLATTLKALIEGGYKYYHYSDDIDGTKDFYGRFVSMSRIFSSTPIKYKNPQNILFIAMSNYHISNMYNIKQLTEAQLLKGPSNFAFFIQESLKK